MDIFLDILRPVIVVLDAHDVVLAEIAAGLHLDQFEVDLAGIFEAMPRADWHVDRFILVQNLTLSPIVTRAVPRTTTQCSAR